MPEYTIETIFQSQADKTGLVNSAKLRNLLIMEGRKRFDKMLVNELIDEFGMEGHVNYDQFCQIWQYLRQIRSTFERYARSGVLSKREFSMVLSDQLNTRINNTTVETLVRFYAETLTFDVCVHALKHLESLQYSCCLKTNCITFEFYRQHVLDGKPTAPFEDKPPSYDEVMFY